MTLSSRDESQRAEILAQFERGEAYMQWRETVTALQSELDKLIETEARCRLRGVADELGGQVLSFAFPESDQIR